MNEVNDECNLVTFNYMPIQFEVAEKEKVLMQATKEGTMLLMSEIFACQYEMTDVGPAAILSKERTKFPREKRIPDTKCETKWEIYAKEKRIRKRKRETRLLKLDALGSRTTDPGAARHVYAKPALRRSQISGHEPSGDPDETVRTISWRSVI